MKTARCHRHSGMSLIELLVTLTILGLVLLATLPSMVGWSRNTQIRTAAEAILNGLQKTRSEALRRNTRVRFSLVTTASGNAGLLDNTCQLSSSSASWVISRADPSGACAAALSDSDTPMIIEKWAQGENGRTVTIAVRNANADGSCSSTATTPSALVFDAFGRLDSSLQSRCIDIDNSTGSSNRALRIIIGSGGTMRMCDPTLSATDDPRRC